MGSRDLATGTDPRATRTHPPGSTHTPTLPLQALPPAGPHPLARAGGLEEGRGRLGPSAHTQGFAELPFFGTRNSDHLTPGPVTGGLVSLFGALDPPPRRPLGVRKPRALRGPSSRERRGEGPEYSGEEAFLALSYELPFSVSTDDLSSAASTASFDTSLPLPALDTDSALQPHRKKIFTCFVSGCSASFTRRAQVQKHYAQVHQRVTPYLCPHADCGKSFGSKGSLSNHMLYVHTPEARYKHKCPHCTRRFPRHQDLARHMAALARPLHVVDQGPSPADLYRMVGTGWDLPTLPASDLMAPTPLPPNGYLLTNGHHPHPPPPPPQPQPAPPPQPFSTPALPPLGTDTETGPGLLDGLPVLEGVEEEGPGMSARLLGAQEVRSRKRALMGLDGLVLGWGQPWVGPAGQEDVPSLQAIFGEDQLPQDEDDTGSLEGTVWDTWEIDASDPPHDVGGFGP